MKKLLSALFLLVAISILSNSAHGMSYEDALNQTKPFAMLIYADWADDVQQINQAFNAQGLKFSEKYNFVTMNIASSDTKEFNKKFHIYPNLPYVLLFKEKGKFSRYLTKDCILNESCFSERLNFFVN